MLIFIWKNLSYFISPKKFHLGLLRNINILVLIKKMDYINHISFFLS